MKTLMRVLLLLLVGIATGVLWMYGSAFLPHELAQGGGSLVTADRSAGILTLLALVIAPAIPVQTLFPNAPVRAAFSIGWIPLALGLCVATPAVAGIPAAHGVAFALIEGSADWMAIVLGAWLASRLRQSRLGTRSSNE